MMTTDASLWTLYNEILDNISRIEAVPKEKVRRFRETGEKVLKGLMRYDETTDLEKEAEFVRRLMDYLNMESERWEKAIKESEETITVCKRKYPKDSKLLQKLLRIKKEQEINYRYYKDLHGRFVDFYLISILRSMHLRKVLGERPKYSVGEVRSMTNNIPDEVPPSLRVELEEAKRCFGMSMLMPALLTCQRSIDRALRMIYSKYAKKKPHGDINSLFQWAVKNDIVRSKYGNFINRISGIHSEENVEENEALYLINETIALVGDLFKY